MVSAFSAVVPIFLVIMLGFLLHRFSFISDTVIKANNKLVFYVFLPALLVYKIADSNIRSMFNFNMVAVLYLSVFIVFVLTVAISVILKINRREIGTVAISSFRGNFAYMGLPVAYYLFSNKGIVVGSMLIAFIVPFVNVLSILSLSVSSGGSYKKAVLDSILTPIVLASVLGIFLSVYGIEIPQIIQRSLKIISLPALTLALLGIGASLKFDEIAKKPLLMVLSSFLKLFILPFVGVLLLKLMPMDNLLAKVLLIMLAAPPATLNYIMAQQLGGDEVLASANICFSTIFSFFTYIFWIFYMNCCM